MKHGLIGGALDRPHFALAILGLNRHFAFWAARLLPQLQWEGVQFLAATRE
jgi:hypothetical protein